MSRPVQIGLWVLALLIALLAGWRITALTVADQLAADRPQEALRWQPDNPTARLALAQQQIEADHPAEASRLAQAVLRQAPLQADAFAILAESARLQGQTNRAEKLWSLAVLRAPRNPLARGRWIDLQLSKGHFAEAFDNLDILINMAPQRTHRLLALLIPLAAQPAFADALAAALTKQPAWRNEMLDQLLQQADHDVINSVFSDLQARDGLSQSELNSWLHHLAQSGHWGEAYSHWVSQLALAPGQTLPLVHDGGFDTTSSGLIFDWQMQGPPGVYIRRKIDHANNPVVHVLFRGRRAPQTGLQQTLLLAPGDYALQFRARAQQLRSDKGLQWTVTCLGKTPQVVGRSALLEGSFEWQDFASELTVPADDCPAQRLALSNPGAAAGGKIVSGSVWLDDIRIKPSALPSTATKPHRVAAPREPAYTLTSGATGSGGARS